MSLTLPKTWTAGEVLTAADLNAQFDAIETKFAGSVLGTEIAAGSIPNSALTNENYEFIVHLNVKPTTAAAPPTSATVPIHVVALPGSTTEGVSYTVISAAAAIRDTGDVGALVTYNVQWGAFTTGAAKDWTTVATVISSRSFTSASAGGNLSDKPAINSATLALTDDAEPRCLGLFLTAVGANALNTAYASLAVDLKIRRTSGLRSA